jgi:acid phosphatase
MESRLAANFYLQTSAEYRACCLQVYKCAEMRLEYLLQSADPKPAKPAVVMDLDETVFDNSAFQTYLYAKKAEFSEPLWVDYEEKGTADVTLVPGAKNFIKQAETWGVTVIYISNRLAIHQAATARALERNGISVKNIDQRLYLKAKEATNSDKSARREAVAARHNVLLYFGDNLRDFSEAFTAKKVSKDAPPEEFLSAIKLRYAVVDEAACHWGIDWFVLPNPVYGEWDKLAGPDPKALLHPSSMSM